MNVSQRWITVKATGEWMPFRAAIPTPGLIYQDTINWERERKADEHKRAETSTFSVRGSNTDISSRSVSNK